ncbi:MAG: protein tyrosine phosphatase (PTP) superfamily phosphohydrolase (DUF442 family) [Planctomycetota bacterium]|jgi:protein tyrosine phosphatase (PTP) superfamily phosphohydrolase (DUF442 family)
MPLPMFLLAGVLGCALASCSGTENPDTADNSPTNTAGAATKLTLYKQSAPLDNVLCSGQPTEAQFDTLKAAGVSRVLHLRQAKEKNTGWEEERAKDAGVEFVRLEIAGKDGLTRENVETFAKFINKETTGTTLVSCGSSNRVGAMFALKAFWLDKMPRDEALALGTKAGMLSLTPAVEKLTSQ